jgi:hypothetical protein
MKHYEKVLEAPLQLLNAMMNVSRPHSAGDLTVTPDLLAGYRRRKREETERAERKGRVERKKGKLQGLHPHTVVISIHHGLHNPVQKNHQLAYSLAEKFIGYSVSEVSESLLHTKSE